MVFPPAQARRQRPRGQNREGRGTTNINTTESAHASTAEDVSIFERGDVPIVDECGERVVGVSFGTDEYVMGRAMELVKDGGKDRLACCLADMSDTLLAPALPSNPSSRW